MPHADVEVRRDYFDLPPRCPVPATTPRSLTVLLIEALARMDHLGYPKVRPTASTTRVLEAS